MQPVIVSLEHNENIVDYNFNRLKPNRPVDIWLLKCQHLIPALIALAARTYCTTKRPIAIWCLISKDAWMILQLTIFLNHKLQYRHLIPAPVDRTSAVPSYANTHV